MIPRSRKGSAVPIVLLIFIALALGGSFFLLVDLGTFGRESSLLKTAIISAVITTAAAMLLFVTWEFSAVNRLNRALKRIAPLVEVESSAVTKKPYLEIYALYLKLSEKKKQNFYTRVNSLRERVEEHLKNELRIERLFQDADKGDIAEQKKTYLNIYNTYEKLPKKVQHGYYPRIVRLRDRLERGN